MSKIKLLILVACMILEMYPGTMQAKNNDYIPVPQILAQVKHPESIDQGKVLLLRLEQIQAMDLSKMSSTEKRKLRKEVKGIERKLSESGGGVYISLGAIIIIVLIIILVF